MLWTVEPVQKIPSWNLIVLAGAVLSAGILALVLAVNVLFS